ncbi:MAG: hypothetical protein LBJ92_02855 [Holosporales bacterium]|jgi:hypothetical protein|nr:hypothetical protein [Holosporales bacterium]
MHFKAPGNEFWQQSPKKMLKQVEKDPCLMFTFRQAGIPVSEELFQGIGNKLEQWRKDFGPDSVIIAKFKPLNHWKATRYGIRVGQLSDVTQYGLMEYHKDGGTYIINEASVFHYQYDQTILPAMVLVAAHCNRQIEAKLGPIVDIKIANIKKNASPPAQSGWFQFQLNRDFMKSIAIKASATSGFGISITMRVTRTLPIGILEFGVPYPHS